MGLHRTGSLSEINNREPDSIRRSEAVSASALEKEEGPSRPQSARCGREASRSNPRPTLFASLLPGNRCASRVRVHSHVSR